MAELRESCPFLVPVVVDRLWQTPTSAYCSATGHVRVPAPSTLARRCTREAHRGCPGYRAAIAAGPPPR